MIDFWQSLRERKLVQWTLAYVAASFALLQGIDIIAQRFAWPDAIERGLIIAVSIGFFVTLLLAWYHGERGAQKVSGTELLLLAFLLLVGGGLLWKFARTAPSVAVAAATPASPAANNNVIADRKTIAVLPFINMSGDSDNAYFSDGISEEILNVLAKTPDLHVAARTSSFSFKGKALEVPQIAEALNVRMVLEGSVRKQGQRVRITAQLIDAKTGFHAWSQTYDRDLKDIFAIQDEIAKSIGDALEVKLADAPKAGKNSVGTTNLKAYDLYLRGIALWQTRDGDKLWQAIDLFNQAIAADPNFAQAYAGQALVYDILPSYTSRISEADSYVISEDFALRALALDPSLPEPYAALSLLSTDQLRRTTAIALAWRAIALRPSFATAHQWLATALMSNGDLTAALASLERASALDPRSPVIADNHAFTLMTLDRYADARDRCLKLLAFDPTHPGCLQYAGMADLMLGDYVAARPLLERLAASLNPSASGQAQELIAALSGHADRHALAIKMAKLPFNSLLDAGSGNALEDQMVAAALMMLGERDLTLDYMNRIAGNLGNNMDWVVMLPLMDPIRCEPRFVAVVKKLKTHDPYAAKVCAGKP